MKFTNGIALGFLTAVLVMNFSSEGRADIKMLKIEGASNLTSMVKDTAAAWGRTNRVGVTVGNGGTSAAVDCLKQKTCELGFLSENVMGENKDVFEFVPYALTSVNIIASKKLPVDALTTQQAQDIFSGKIKNWKEVGGPDMPIKPVQRRTNTLMHEVFAKKVPVPASLEKVEAVQALFNRFKTPDFQGGVSYTSGAMPEHMKIIKLDGSDHSAENVRAGKHPLIIKFYLASRKDAAGNSEVAGLMKHLLETRKPLFDKEDLVIP